MAVANGVLCANVSIFGRRIFSINVIRKILEARDIDFLQHTVLRYFEDVHAARHAKEKSAMLERPVVREMIAKAIAIEPQVARPYGERKVTWPPYKHDFLPVFKRSARLKEMLRGQPADNIILLPGGELSPASRACITTFCRKYPAQRTVVFFTEQPGRVSEGLLPESGVEFFDFTAIAAANFNPGFRMRLMVDVTSGLLAKRLLSAESKLGLDVMQNYGRQLSSWMELSLYAGNGEQSLQLHSVFNELSFLYLKTDKDRAIVIDRYKMPRVVGERLLVIDDHDVEI